MSAKLGQVLRDNGLAQPHMVGENANRHFPFHPGRGCTKSSSALDWPSPTTGLLRDKKYQHILKIVDT
jgi:hypothetical protein